METSITVPVDGLDTFVFREGSGPPLVMLHGMAATSDCWLYAFEALKSHYTTIAPDLPGHGRSGGRVHPYGLDFYLEWLDGLLKALGTDDLILMGNSMGGAISLAYAMAHPERVQRLILVDALGLGTKLSFSVAGTMTFRLPYFFAGMLTQQTDPYLLRYFQSWSFLNPWGSPKDVIARMAELNRQKGLWAFAAGTRLLLVDFLLPGKRRAFVRRLSEITGPTLITWGRHDGLLPVANAYDGAKRIPNARLCIFENSAHAPMLEEPEAFNAAVQEFLADN
ncbi:MAG: alpha/beta hydrolase [Anaerolineae bacterium]|nr:alpha/beta hydrolase [Anaerolineae bacterium]